jgi:hypothetical protein
MSDLASVNTYTRVKDQTKYLMAAWLASQLPTHAADNAVINGTIWNLMSTAGLILTGDATPTSWLGQASANYSSVNAADWVVVTDKIGYMNQAGTFTVTGQGQEQIVNVTPEPATLLLLGTGLLTLMAAGVLRRSAV